MIIKSKPIKSFKNLSNVLRYILVGHDIIDNGFVLSRFLRGDRKYHKELLNAKGNTILETSILENRIASMLAQFKTNDKKRLVPHTRANKAYHEIISFHAKDAKFLSKEDMLKVARKYAKERSPNSLVVASMHRNKQHLHIHCVISAVEYETGLVNRLSKKQFREVKMILENYQHKELHLQHSKVDHSKKKRSH